ncbi:VOC family protein [Sporobacter termitidis]|uniref:VOC family protein n=1 Tax=Sporobacter termitidis TaxID=44749 RepID=UPI001FA833F7|nr:VOC family protein [Sporobacter termitidis]
MKLGCVTLDSGNAEEHADFYQKLLGWTIRFTNTDEGLKFVGIVNEATGMTLLFQEDNDYVPPVWPTKPGQQQQMAHLDFHTDDLEKDVNHAISCGAKLAETQYSDKWRVMIDPAGHPFCIEKLS